MVKRWGSYFAYGVLVVVVSWGFVRQTDTINQEHHDFNATIAKIIDTRVQGCENNNARWNQLGTFIRGLPAPTDPTMKARFDQLLAVTAPVDCSTLKTKGN